MAFEQAMLQAQPRELSKAVEGGLPSLAWVSARGKAGTVIRVQVCLTAGVLGFDLNSASLLLSK